MIDAEALARAQVNGHAEPAEPADHALMARTLTELRQRATLLDLLRRALTDLLTSRDAYRWATLMLASAAWGGVLFVAPITTHRTVACVLFTVLINVPAWLPRKDHS